MTRVAAFDCGTNSLRLLIADLDPENHTATELVREMRIVRLGEGVDRTGRLTQAALDRVFATLREYVDLVERHDVEKVRFCATSAARDAENADEFVEGVRALVGVEPEVLAGEEEAHASFLGATRALATHLPTPYLVVDIGGGSTELVLGDDDGHVHKAVSLDIGSVRLYERHLRSDPADPGEIAALRDDVDAALDASGFDLSRAGSVIGVAGTITTLAAGVLDLPAYDRSIVHHAVLHTTALHRIADDLLAMTVEQRKALGYMHPGRADVIGAGAMILSRVLRHTPVSSVLVSEQDILDGIAWSALDQPTSGYGQDDRNDQPGPATGPPPDQPPPDQGS